MDVNRKIGASCTKDPKTCGATPVCTYPHCASFKVRKPHKADEIKLKKDSGMGFRAAKDIKDIKKKHK